VSPDIPQFTEGLDAAKGAMQDLRIVSRDALGEIDAAAQNTFRRIEGFMVRSLETGKFEWRGLAGVALQSIRDILNEQLRASGAESSLFGGGGGGILGSLFQIGAGLLGPAGGGGASSAALSTALSLSGPRFQFAHGGRPPVGKASVVGEDGPELFIPDELGTIVANDRLGASGGGAATTVNVTQSFDFRGADLAAVAALRREAVRIKREVMAEIINSARRGGTFARLPSV
jgi:lambda family phage tail tape measure protein